jgi:cytochrome c-type biogenesis protein CcmH
MMKNLLLAGLMFFVLGVSTAPAKEALPVGDDPVVQARMMRLATVLRCLVCQNQTIADSHADLASDLRNQIVELIHQGKTDSEIMDYMTERYGDFVLYRPLPYIAQRKIVSAIAQMKLNSRWNKNV